MPQKYKRGENWRSQDYVGNDHFDPLMKFVFETRRYLKYLSTIKKLNRWEHQLACQSQDAVKHAIEIGFHDKDYEEVYECEQRDNLPKVV